MEQFTVSKLECMAIRRQEWLFQIMPLSYEQFIEIGLYQKANQICDEWNNKLTRKISVGWGFSKYKLTCDVVRELMSSKEFHSEIQKIKSKIWKDMTTKYTLIKEKGGGMYKDYTVIIQDNKSGKFYQGACNNYGGDNWPNVTFTEVIPTTEPKVRYEIPNQG